MSGELIAELQGFSKLIGKIYSDITDTGEMKVELKSIISLAKEVAEDNARWVLEYKITYYDLVLQKSKLNSLALAMERGSYDESEYGENEYEEDVAQFDEAVELFVNTANDVGEAVGKMNEQVTEFMEYVQNEGKWKEKVPKERWGMTTFLIGGITSAINLMDNYHETIEKVTEQGEIREHYQQVIERLDDTVDKSYM